MRGIKRGWYAIDGDGNLVAGPFSSREHCIERSSQPTNGSTPSALLDCRLKEVFTGSRSVFRATSEGPTRTARRG
jgi:hypothetical protein